MLAEIKYVNCNYGYGYLRFVATGRAGEDDYECEGYFSEEKTNQDLFIDLYAGDLVKCRKLWKRKDGKLHVEVLKIISKVSRKRRYR